MIEHHESADENEGERDLHENSLFFCDVITRHAHAFLSPRSPVSLHTLCKYHRTLTRAVLSPKNVLRSSEHSPGPLLRRTGAHPQFYRIACRQDGDVLPYL